jgi:hypothetical protein
VSLKADVVPVVDQPLPGPNAAGGTKSVAKIVPTGGLEDYLIVALGSVSLGAAAEHNLELKSQGKAWSEVRLRRVRIVPAP